MAIPDVKVSVEINDKTSAQLRAVTRSLEFEHEHARLETFAKSVGTHLADDFIDHHVPVICTHRDKDLARARVMLTILDALNLSAPGLRNTLDREIKAGEHRERYREPIRAVDIVPQFAQPVPRDNDGLIRFSIYLLPLCCPACKLDARQPPAGGHWQCVDPQCGWSGPQRDCIEVL